MERFVITDGIFERYSGEDSHVVIPDEVDRIGSSAFRNCKGLQSVVIPGSVISIEDEAFWGCENLHTVVISDGVVSIESFVFWGCENLRTVSVPPSVTSINGSAFIDTPWINTLGEFAIVNGILLQYNGDESVVSIPEGVTHIESGFEDNSEIWDVVFPDSVIDIYQGAFEGTSWLDSFSEPFVVVNGVLIKYRGHKQDIAIPKGVKSISAQTFCYNDEIRSVIIPEGVVYIGQEAFWNCSDLRMLEIPQSVSWIGSNAFRDVPLETIVLPEHITDIEAIGLTKNTKIIRKANVASTNCKPELPQLPSLPGWKLITVDAEEYLQAKRFAENRSDGMLHYPTGYCAFRGPAYIVDLLRKELEEEGEYTLFPTGVAQVVFDPYTTRRCLSNSILKEYAALRFACFDSTREQYVAYSETGDPGITKTEYLDSAKDEGDHWIHGANVLQSGQQKTFDSRTGTTSRIRYRFPFNNSWESDEYIIQIDGVCYLCTPPKG